LTRVTSSRAIGSGATPGVVPIWTTTISSARCTAWISVPPPPVVQLTPVSAFICFAGVNFSHLPL